MLNCASNDFKYAHEISSNNKLLSSKIKLHSPKPSYKIISKSKNKSSIYKEVEYEILPCISFSKYEIPFWIKVSLYSINYNKKKKIIGMHIENNFNKKKLPLSSKKVILYSHENRTDIIRLLPFLIDLSVQNKCNIISYDYRGFGCSSSQAKEKNFIDIYEVIMKFSLDYLNYKIENILLMGRDIGANHSLIIASRNKYKSCKGLILISPVISERILDINSMKSIICHTLLIKEKEENSGDNEEDEIILFCRQITNENEWFPKHKSLNSNDKNLFKNEDYLIIHRKKFLNLIKEYIKSDNNDKNNFSLSRISTTATILDNKEHFIEVLENNNEKNSDNKNLELKVIQNNNNRDEFEEDEDDNISYDNDDY